METLLKGTLFSNSILSGLMTGIIAAVVNLIYSIVYRDTTSFATANIVMPFSIFIGFPILLVFAGYAYFLLQKYLHVGTNWFIFSCIAFMIALILFTLLATRQNTGALLSGLRGLCLGMEIITCLLAAFLIPFLTTHPKIYG